MRAHVTLHVNKDTESNPANPANPFEWILDSASNIHLTPFKERFVKYTSFAEPQDIIGLEGMTTQPLDLVLSSYDDQQNIWFKMGLCTQSRILNSLNVQTSTRYWHIQ